MSGYFVSPEEKAVVVPAGYLMKISPDDKDAFIHMAEEINYHLLITYGEEMRNELTALRALSGNVQTFREPSPYHTKEEVMERGFCPSHVICLAMDENNAMLLREEGLRVYETTAATPELIKKLRCNA